MQEVHLAGISEASKNKTEFQIRLLKEINPEIKSWNLDAKKMDSLQKKFAVWFMKLPVSPFLESTGCEFFSFFKTLKKSNYDINQKVALMEQELETPKWTKHVAQVGKIPGKQFLPHFDQWAVYVEHADNFNSLQNQTNQSQSNHNKNIENQSNQTNQKPNGENSSANVENQKPSKKKKSEREKESENEKPNVENEKEQKIQRDWPEPWHPLPKNKQKEISENVEKVHAGQDYEAKQKPCPRCGNIGFYTNQTKSTSTSADEGPGVAHVCTHPNHNEKIHGSRVWHESRH